MSADNWAICPRCLRRAEAAREIRIQAADDAYGRVPADEYQRLQIDAQTPLDHDGLQTFREDYEFYLDDEGAAVEVVASYKGGCRICGLHLEFKTRRPLYNPATDDGLPSPPETPTPSPRDPADERIQP